MSVALDVNVNTNTDLLDSLVRAASTQIIFVVVVAADRLLYSAILRSGADSLRSHVIQHE